jgi:hypothetical protein
VASSTRIRIRGRSGYARAMTSAFAPATLASSGSSSMPTSWRKGNSEATTRARPLPEPRSTNVRSAVSGSTSMARRSVLGWQDV